MTHIRPVEPSAQTVPGLSPTKAAWRTGRLVAPREVLELLSRLQVRRVATATGERYVRVRPGRDGIDRPRPGRSGPNDENAEEE